jgi:hypothetical protein
MRLLWVRQSLARMRYLLVLPTPAHQRPLEVASRTRQTLAIGWISLMRLHSFLGLATLRLSAGITLFSAVVIPRFAIYHGLDINSGNPMAAFGPSTSAWFTNASSISFGAVTDNVWVHLAVVRQGNTFRTYKNGVQQSTGTTDSAGQSLGSISALRIGRGSDFYNKCLIDDFRVTKGVCRYPSGTTFTPPTTGLPID